MIKINEAIIVEGKYDKIRLSSIVDAVIIETNGFSIFKDKEKMKLINDLAKNRGIIILTDSDASGFMIRSKLSSSIAPKFIKQAYIPDIFGKEKRKSEISKEGKIGVEGMEKQVILEALRQAGAMVSEESKNEVVLEKVDLFDLGLIGQKDSSYKRRVLLKELNLPERLSSKMLLNVINKLYTKEEFFNIINKI